jgi:ABC-2 type transport system ATP-binding protein
VIQLEAISKSFNGKTVLRDLSLAVEAGERVALVGANGAGKTTLIRCLLGEYRFDGELLVDGRSPRLQRRELLQGVGFVPQLPPPLRMPVGQLLRFAAGLCGGEPEPMEEVARRLGLEPGPIRHHSFAKLSGGQKQKLLIAVALGRQCRLLLMDEPAANLDPEARGSFFDLLEERAASTTMLISSHRLDEVAPLVHRVVELDRGRVVLDEAVADSGALGSRMRCRLGLRRGDQAVAKSLAAWGFEPLEGGKLWEGEIAGPDRLRFLGMLSRYTGLISEVRLDENSSPEE